MGVYKKANPYSKQYEFKQVFCNRRQSLLIKFFFSHSKDLLMASFKQENGANEVGTQVITMKTITDIQLHEPSVLDSYTNHPCGKELENGCVNVNIASSQILGNIFQ